MGWGRGVGGREGEKRLFRINWIHMDNHGNSLKCITRVWSQREKEVAEEEKSI